jgi:hypothetical protein
LRACEELRKAREFESRPGRKMEAAVVTFEESSDNMAAEDLEETSKATEVVVELNSEMNR